MKLVWDGKLIEEQNKTEPSWKYFGMCRCEIDNPKKYSIPKSKCPLHGEAYQDEPPVRDK